MRAATDKQAVADYAQEVLAGTGWEVTGVHRRGTRLEPPDSYWSVLSVDINKEGEERELRLVVRGALNDPAWDSLSARLVRQGAGRPVDPLNDAGFPRLFPETRHAYWFYPFDPSMPALALANDAVRVAGVLIGETGSDPVATLAASRNLLVQRVRYVPEIVGILRYTLDLDGAPARIFGKVQPGGRGLRALQVVQGLWRAAAKYPGYLNLPRPLGYVEEMGMMLEEAVKGRAVSSNRTSAEFAMTGNAAAEAIAVIHESDVTSDLRIDLEREIARLDRVVEQFTYVLPEGHFLLKDLITHMRERVRRTTDEQVLPTHGDLKYDQFLFHNDQYTLLDFDYFAMAETSYDLGKFCGYLVPSQPKDWAQSVAAEEVRGTFIRRYRELRPHATMQRFQIYEALCLGLRAMASMWTQLPGWEHNAESLLVLAFERLKSRLPE
ncbi:MAG TPA: phosphotransferase [Candidatus Dormibacteraeota bacterium]|nr:phosphotransferase [Candidatus Dormibacteraeota bacterium]